MITCCELVRQQRFPRGLDEVFAYMSDARNLAGAMPRWLRLVVRTPLPVVMHEGTVIEYRLHIYGIPVPWRSEFTQWEPPRRFAYVQRRGPFRAWYHAHEFWTVDNGTVMRDLVRYRVPGGRIVQQLVVGRLLDRLFRDRAARLEAVLGGPAGETQI